MNTTLWYLRTKVKLFLGKGVRESYAQFGEDLVVDSVLRDVINGTYIDVGAFDPVLYSNTYHFYKKGWHGLVIDPNASLHKKFSLLRPRDTFISAGIAAEKGTQTYYAFNDGAYNTFDEQEKEHYLKGNSSLRLTHTAEVSVVPLRDILEAHNITSIDFMSIDAQGLDLQVLRSMGNLRPKVIAVEIESGLQDIQQNPTYRFLIEKGYTLAGAAGLTLLFRA